MKLTPKIVYWFIIVLPIIQNAQPKKTTQVKSGSFILSFSSKQARFIDSTQNKFTVRDFYEFTDASKPGTFKLPSEDILIAIPPNSHPQFRIISKSDTTINNVIPAINDQPYLDKDSTIKLKKIDYKFIGSNQVNSQDLEVKNFFWFRDFYCAHIRINNYSFDARSSSIRVIKNMNIEVSFSQPQTLNQISPIQIKSKYDYRLTESIFNSDIAEQFRSTSKIVLNDTTGNWINYNSTYLKIGIANDGLFRINKSDLENFGISTASINPQTFQLFGNGKEVPLFVSNETSSVFSNTDYIEFFATKNYPTISHRIINLIKNTTNT
jgi:hypothetical protein